MEQATPQRRVILNAIFPGDPVAWQRVALRGPYMHKPEETRKAQARLRRQLKMLKPKLRPDSRSRFGLQFVFRTTSRSKDFDNCIKLVADAFNKKIWWDDCQIDEGTWKMERVLSGAVHTHLIVYVIEGGPTEGLA